MLPKGVFLFPAWQDMSPSLSLRSGAADLLLGALPCLGVPDERIISVLCRRLFSKWIIKRKNVLVGVERANAFAFDCTVLFLVSLLLGSKWGLSSGF